MPSKKYEESRLEISNIDHLLLTEMGFSVMKRKKIRFNLKPFFKPKQQSNTSSVDKNIVDLHWGISRKIDDLIIKHEKELQTQSTEPVTKIKHELPLNMFIEPRNPFIRKPEIPHFVTDIGPENVSSEIAQEEFFEIVQPEDIPINNDFHSWMLNETEKKSHKLFMGLSNIKIKTKASNQSKTSKDQKASNGFTKTKIELEKTKQEIEERKKALEKAVEKEKRKEEELKLAEKEKIKQKKLATIELKKKEKEQRIKQKESKKLEKLKQKELKIQEREKQRLEKLREIERERQEKELEKTQKQKEELSLLESKKKKEKKKKESHGFFKKEKTQVVSDIQEDKKQTETFLDSEVGELLPILDELLEKLPEDVIDDFAQSDKFTLYQKVMNKYKK